VAGCPVAAQPGGTKAVGALPDLGRLDARIRERLGFAMAYDLQRTVKESID